jgi:CDP-diacylglycerol pyrophosphatase
LQAGAARAGAWPLVLLLALAACAPKPAPEAAHAPDPNGLLHAMQACLADPRGGDCTEVDRARGFVVIKDDSPEKPRAWLIVPDHEVTGIESPAVFRPPVADFWRYGWEAGERLLPGHPAGDRGLAINSKAGRTQNLLHIHISCVQPAVRAALAGAEARGAIGGDWASGPFLRLGDDLYNVRKVAALDPSPFLRLAELPGARADMGEQSLAAIGSGDGGFFLVTDSTAPGVVAETEALLDERCAG